MTPPTDLANQPPTVPAALAKKLEKLGIRRRFDLVLHLPLRYEDETHLYPIADAPYGQPVLVEGAVVSHEVSFKPRKQLRVQIEDGSGVLLLRFIHFYPSQIKQFAEGSRVRALGEIRRGFLGDEMVHPKTREVREGAPLAESLTPVYPTVNGLTQPMLRKLVHGELRLQQLGEVLPPPLLEPLALQPFAEAIRLLHQPPPEWSAQQLADPRLPAWQRLKFDELLAQQLSMRLAYRARRQGSAPRIVGDGSLSARLLQNLPFQLTAAQRRVLEDIRADLALPHPMHRLLQGDVGSGKTIVAALAALSAIEAGYQVALMAPTEILAEQHYLKLSGWLAPLGIGVAWLSGSLRKKAKAQALEEIAAGRCRLAVGTHALFQDDVRFERLGLAIVDEQHRFGVGQRLALQGKGEEPHQLMMSATPIPRTLAMSFYADLDVSVIDELPPGRTPIVTKLIGNPRRPEVVGLVERTCAEGQQAYWVCPLIEESEALQLQTAVDSHQQLQQDLPGRRIGLVHGRMKAAEKAVVMAAFAGGELDVLVATTVIEVGVDVPNASLMVIEHAERMGLAQLHQLRGRVGRGSARSVCVLLFDSPLSDLAKARLKVIYENVDGFEIARQDLQIRGPGEFLGARQSGLPMLRFADLEQDQQLLEAARDLAPQLLERWPQAADAHLERWLAGKEQFLKA
ncbi:ATP-dependent DNA helicase RecG [Chromobacterium sphagni]|uniref:ATP-dependent DNA helicase RecG n=1 Tax=Chromobacterium sphagni TaxID=1903179 RepID=A0A1S1X3A5_9NEIS|nr:ATP-dependent DNA helicase RecG [Chromobacterium sphagni]OHX13900.1 ATP-dependent DNA helicase RecG [Chromobacterium sphagni]OHX20108.1 ATP-dependent DNA helicase RecG [Chromobacterium sphagni]